MNIKNRPLWLWPVIIISIGFGVLTIKSGGSVIFIDGPDRQAAGNYVNFIVWFNFIAGFFYIMAGLGFLLNKNWVLKLSAAIAATTVMFFTAFGIHILMDGSYEMRTVIAMSMRSVIWLSFTYAAYIIVSKKKDEF